MIQTWRRELKKAEQAYKIGRLDEAEPLYRRALDVQPDDATTLSNLGVACRRQGKHAVAERYFETALDIQETQLGPDHPDVAMTLDSLVTLYYERGEYRRALPLEEEQLDRLNLGMMVPDYENSTPYGTAFTVSIEAREGVTTGISAADRSRTVRDVVTLVRIGDHSCVWGDFLLLITHSFYGIGRR